MGCVEVPVPPARVVVAARLEALHLRVRAARPWLGKLLLPVWAVCFLIIGATLMAGHSYTLPRPDTSDPAVATALNGLRGPDDRGRWLAVHVLYAKCRCSQRIFEHLFERRARSDFSEKVVLVGENADYERRARAAGYGVSVIAPAELGSRFHVQAAPLLVVLSEAGDISYLGGYTERKQGLSIRDQEILVSARSHKPFAELPLFGCAVSRSLQKLLDPLHIKYDRTEEP